MRKQQRKRIDPEIMTDVQHINKFTPFKTLGSCAGHGIYPPTIVVEHIRTKHKFEWFSGISIPRKTRFYVRDSNGEYFIPEVKPLSMKQPSHY